MRRALTLAWIGLASVLHSAAATVEATCTYTNGCVEKRTIPLVQEGRVQRFRWTAAEIPPGIRHIELRPEFATASTGEDGYFVMPNGFLGTFREQNGEHALASSCMPMFGMKTPRTTFVAIVTGLPHEYTLVARAKEGVYTLFTRFQLEGRAPRGDIAIDYHFLDGGDADYSGMARTYRAHQLARKACVPLKERISKSPELAYAARCVEVRIRQGWKPAPSPIEEQTPETEPSMKTVVTFDRVGRILDEFKRQGVGRIMGEAKAVFGGVSSEGPWDFCCDNLDYALYVSFSGLTKRPPMVDRMVPIWQLVYHGIVMSNPFAEMEPGTVK